MSFLSNVVAQMVANMAPEERREAITEVTGQVLALMNADERLDLTHRLYLLLLDGLDPVGRTALVARLGEALTARVAEG